MVVKIKRACLSIAFFVNLFSLLTKTVNALCPLCSSAGVVPPQLQYVVSAGRTCLNVYLDLAGLSPSSSQCIQQQQLYRNVCCSSTAPPPTYIPPTPAPVYNGPVGNNPVCPICGTLEYPGIPSGFIVARYVGDYSCRQLYDLGLHGLIKDFMCKPLQIYAKPVCGCGEYNPKCIADKTKCYSGSSSTSASSPVQGQASPTASSPASAPSISSWYNNRKTSPSNAGKSSTKLSSNRGGAAGHV